MSVPVILPLCEPIGRAACGRDFIGNRSFSFFKVGGVIVTVGVGFGGHVVCFVGCLRGCFGADIRGGCFVAGGDLCRNFIVVLMLD